MWMNSSELVAGINKDSEAPIFKVADFGIVGDPFDVVPVIIAELKKLESERWGYQFLQGAG